MKNLPPRKVYSIYGRDKPGAFIFRNSNRKTRSSAPFNFRNVRAGDLIELYIDSTNFCTRARALDDDDAVLYRLITGAAARRLVIEIAAVQRTAVATTG